MKENRKNVALKQTVANNHSRETLENLDEHRQKY